MDSSSPRVIQVIQEIKDYVEKPRRCGWLDNMIPEESKRHKARRYRDGAVKIMDLLRPELTTSDINSYERYYEQLRDIPEGWTSAQLTAAKKLWEYVVSLDEWLSHDRITSLALSTDNRRPSYSRPAHRQSDDRRVQFRQPPSTPHSTRPPPALEGPKQPILGTSWWPGTYYSPAWVPTPIWYSPPPTYTSSCPISWATYWPGASYLRI